MGTSETTDLTTETDTDSWDQNCKVPPETQHHAAPQSPLHHQDIDQEDQQAAAQQPAEPQW